MLSKPLWEASVKQAAEPTSFERHIESCLENGIRLEDIGGRQWHGILQFKFRSRYQMEWVEKNGPWNFDNNLLLLC